MACVAVGGVALLPWRYSPLAGPGDFLLLAQNKVAKEKGAPARRPYLARS